MFPIINTLADEEKTLFIVINDYTTNLPIDDDILYEKNKYDIAIGCEGEYGYEYNVTVTLPWGGAYVTSEELPWITIEIPNYEDYPEFVITAFKEGYMTAEKVINILKGKLSLTTDRGTVKEKESFSVIVKDQDANEIEESIVFLDGFEDNSDTTGFNGVGYLSSPDVEDNAEIKIYAFKEGYLTGSTTIRIENISEEMVSGGLLPIIAALIIVILSMVFVKFKNRSHQSKNKTKKAPKKKVQAFKCKKNKSLQDVNHKKLKLEDKGDNMTTTNKKEPWVEEIRIHRIDKKKETKVVVSEDIMKKNTNKKRECEWFKGKDYMKYKIDELTGEIDNQKDGKWFEGVDHIRLKVDKKLRDSYKNAKKREQF